METRTKDGLKSVIEKLCVDSGHPELNLPGLLVGVFVYVVYDLITNPQFRKAVSDCISYIPKSMF